MLTMNVAQLLLLVLQQVAAYTVSPRLSAAASSPAAEAKASLIKSLLYNKAMPENGQDLIATIEAAGGNSLPDEWWNGCFVLNSCREVAVAMRKRGGPLLDGAPVTMTVEEAGSKVTLETDMLVVGCATGVRIFGAVVDKSAGSSITIEATDCEFFEPSEEFGITKALNKCEAELRPQLPSADAPVRMSFVPRYCDDEILVVAANVGDGADPLTLVLTKDEAAVEVAKRRRG